MLGVPFSDLGDSSTQVSFNDVLSGDFENGAQIQCYNPETGVFDRIYTYSETYGEWRLGWGSADDDSALVEPGVAFWLKTSTAIPITLKGAVAATTVDFTSPASGYKMIAAEAPIEFNLNGENVNWEGLKPGDQLQFIKDGEMVVRYYSSSGKWAENGWGTIEAKDSIPIGTSFWLLADPGIRLRVSPKVMTVEK